MGNLVSLDLKLYFLFYQINRKKMKIFAPLLIAAANAETCSVCEETTVQTLSKDFATPKDPTNHFNQLNGCFLGGNQASQTTTCEGTCFALFFAYKGVDGNGETFYTQHAERGCKHTRKYLGKEVDFPSSTDCAQSNGCAITLTKENFGLGNQGTIKGVFYQSETQNTVSMSTTPNQNSPTFGSGQMELAPMKCLQYSSGASLTTDAACFNAANSVTGHCPDFRSTSCYSRTAWYTAPKESTTAEYKLAERGCSTLPADEAKNRKISYFIGEVPREPQVDFELEHREVIEEHCDSENCNDFKPTEKSTSGASVAAFSALTSLLIAMAFNN